MHWIVLAIVSVWNATALSAVLEWKQEAGYRVAQTPEVTDGRTGFSRLHPSMTGVLFTNYLSQSLVADNRIFDNGSGVALGDVDGDGLCDIYLCRLQGPNALYRNRGGWKFEEITQGAGVACETDFSTGAVLADIDGDTDLDLLVNSIGGGTRLFINDGRGRFGEKVNTGLLPKLGSTSLALADTDGDGDLDLYVANYRTNTFKDAPPGLEVSLFQRGEEVIAQPAERFFALRKGQEGVHILERGETDLLYRNNGQGEFSVVPWIAGGFLDPDGQALREPPRYWGLSAMFYDFNGDRAPDLYVCNDFAFSYDLAWLNNGAGRFQALPRLAWRSMSMSSMGVDFADINRDGHADFVVVEMLSRDHRRRQIQRANVHRSLMSLPTGAAENQPELMRNTLFLNRGDGTYAEIAQLSGLAASEWSWSAVFLDVDLDGYEDLLVTTGNGHDVLDSDAHAHVAERQKAAGPRQPLKPMPFFPRLETPNLAFRNQRDLTFSEMGQQWGFDTSGISHGMALADLDNDGDLDAVVNNLNAPPGLYRNETSSPRLAVRLQGAPPNTKGIGAKIRVSGGPVEQTQEIICGGRYLSSDDPLRVFAAGTATNALTIEVIWRSGRRSVVQGAKANHYYLIQESVAERPGVEGARGLGGQGEEFSNSRSQIANFKSQDAQSQIPNLKSQISDFKSQAPDLKASNGSEVASATSRDGPQVSRFTFHAAPYFEDRSELLRHTHQEEAFDDFARQPLLPNRLSQLGPGVSWHDWDGDGWDDLLVGAGRGGFLGLFRNDGQGRFMAITDAPVNRSLSRDLTSILGFGSNLIAGSSNYEDGSTNGGCIRIYDLHRRAAGDSLLGQLSSTGPLAMADIDGDDDLDLFVGGRCQAGRYPEPASSMLMKQELGRFVLAERLDGIGLVSGAAFSDLTGDGFPELILACEWGPVRIYRNNRGEFAPWNPPVDLDRQSLAARPEHETPHASRFTLHDLTGWWNGVATGDFDADGRLDIVASNWGRNSKYEAWRQRPLQVYYGDFSGQGSVDLLEAYFDPVTGRAVPWTGLDVLRTALPRLAERFSKFSDYASTGISELLGESKAAVLEARWMETTLFLNRGDRFEARALPIEAQFAPVFGLAVADFDGDGREDAFLSQNFFPVQPETSRYDAGRGLWLKGDGQGNLDAVPGQASGVIIYGDQRGCALSDYDGDGRVDLVVGQNLGPTKLYRNAQGRPGMRLRLKGPEGNRAAIGATVRLMFGEQLGPAREIQAGSGYWSQNSAVQVLATLEAPTHLWVRWPGGKIATVSLPKQAREIELTAQGDLNVLR